MEFQNLPQQIQEWLASEKLTYLIISLNRKIGAQGERESLVPSLIYSLATQEVAPEAIPQILIEEKVGDESTIKFIRQTMRDILLRPIQPALNNLGIDIEKIALGLPVLSAPPGFGAPAPVTPVPTLSEFRETNPPAPAAPMAAASIPGPTPPAKAAPIPPPVDLRNKQPAAPERATLNPARPAPVKSPPPADQPFILHREGGPSSMAPPTLSAPTPVPTQKPTAWPADHPQTVNLRVSSQTQTPSPAPASIPPAPKLPNVPAPLEKPKSAPVKRVVHYSGPVTPIG